MLNSEKADLLRIKSSNLHNREERAFIGQFLTPSPIASFMASLFEVYPKSIKLLDPGCGVGSLFSSVIDEISNNKNNIKSLHLTTYEIDKSLFKYIDQTIDGCKKTLDDKNIAFSYQNLDHDFILSQGGSNTLIEVKKHTHAIINPPYKKINSNSEHRKALRSSIGLETVNMYTAFLGLAIDLLEDNGELVAIIPRSFCNGTYYLPFRKFLLEKMTIKKLHLFESRKKAFASDGVLQENIIIYCKKEKTYSDIIITSSSEANFTREQKTGQFTASNWHSHIVKYDDVIKSEDDQQFIRIPTAKSKESDIDKILYFPAKLDDLKIEVSTGPIVDFRIKDYLRQIYEKGSTVPLLYSCNLRGTVEWPKNTKKPNAIEISEASQKLLWLNSGYYLLVKRFSSKEEKKRIVATFYDSYLPEKFIGFENKVNVFHYKKKGIETDNLVKGLYIYLNSSLLDEYYRNFSGHTQVNATDLRSLRYPSKESLVNLGKKIKKFPINQEEIDIILNEEMKSIVSHQNVN